MIEAKGTTPEVACVPIDNDVNPVGATSMAKNEDGTVRSRRRLLKIIAAGGGAVMVGKGLPEGWSRPVIDTVMLPAHAQTSPGGFVSSGILPPAVVGSADDNSLFTGLANMTVETAQANSFDPEVTCIRNNGNGTVTVEAIVLSTDRYQQVVTVGGPKVTMDYCAVTVTNNSLGLINDAHALDGHIVEVQIDSIDGNAQGLLFVNGSAYTIDNPPGPCTLGACMSAMPSDRNIKQNFAAVDEQEILQKVAGLQIEHWNYNDREPGVRHIGPMAQDFMAAFQVGDSDQHIHVVDANGVNLAAIKALYQKLEDKDARIRDLEQKIETVLARLEQLEE
jgi:hypothetical protein